MKLSGGRKGQNPGEAEKEARRKVLGMLPQDETRISWSELAEKAKSQGMSFRTLRKHLDELEHTRVVARNVDTFARPPRVYYQLQTSKVFPGIFDRLPPEMLDARPWVVGIGELEHPDLKERALDALLEMQTNLLTMELARIWEWGVTFGEDQQALSFYKIVIESYLAPMIMNLGLLCRAYRDLVPKLLSSFFDRYAEGYNKASAEVVGIVSAWQATKQERKVATKRA